MTRYVPALMVSMLAVGLMACYESNHSYGGEDCDESSCSGGDPATTPDPGGGPADTGGKTGGGGTVLEPCVTDDGCDGTEYCSAEGQCLPKCTSDEQCGDGEGCLACGKCQPKDTPATCGSAPRLCSDSVPCGDGKQCRAGRCHFTCETSAKCPVGQVCGADGLCADNPAPEQAECVFDFQCSAATCVNGTCHDTCSEGAQCPGTGSVCTMGVCQPDYSPNI